MKCEQKKWQKKGGWSVVREAKGLNPQLVLAFGGLETLRNPARFEDVKKMYPNARIIAATTAGEIIDGEVLDESVVLTAVEFERTPLEFVETQIEKAEDSEAAGSRLAGALPKDGLMHVMVFSEGLKINGTMLVKGMSAALPPSVSITGGLVGGGNDFKETLLGLDAAPVSGNVVAVGFYGDAIKIGYGSFGGWDNFGPDRVITKSANNILYGIDGKPALALYKEYLGDKAKDLPASGLLFPMSLRLKNEAGEDVEVVRTLLGIDEATQGMIFAGDMPEGVTARLMKANFERLIEGASGAASMSLTGSGSAKPELAILISCIGRKLVLKERAVEEIDAVRSVIGPEAAIVGFYSYGEICPTAPTEKQCRLHNQTMTITVMRED